MITWLQRVLQRHYKWLFTLMLAIVIIAFVFTVGASPGIGRSKYSRKKQDYYGYDINSPQEVKMLFKEANLSNLLNTGKNIANSNVAESLALIRPPLLDLADKLQIPNPNEYNIVEYIKTKPLFKGSNGQFDEKKYEEFIKIIKSDPEMDEDLVRAVLGQDYRMEHVIKLLSGSGQVLPYEAKFGIERQQTLWSVGIASLDFEDFNPDVSIPEEKLKEYYETNKHNFAIPQRIQLNYLFFPTEQYISKVAKPSEKELEHFYDANLNLFKDENGNAKSFTEIKDKVIEFYKKSIALRLAAESANEFLLKIYNKQIKHGSKEFTDALNEGHLSLKDLPPFDNNTIPEGTGLPKALLQQGSALNETHFYSDVATNEKGTYILIFKQTLPVHIPSLEEIRNQIKEEYLTSENSKLLESKSKVIEKNFSNAIKSGVSFKDAAKKEGLKVTSYSKFKILEAPKEIDRSLLRNLQLLNAGETSPMLRRGERIYFLHVQEKEVPSIGYDNPDVQALLKQFEPFTASMRGQMIVSELVEEGLKKATKSLE